MSGTRLKLVFLFLTTSLACTQYAYIPPTSFTYDGPVSDGISHRPLTRDDFQAPTPIAPSDNGQMAAQTAVACVTDAFFLLPSPANRDGSGWATSLERVRVRAIMYPKASWWDPRWRSWSEVQRMLAHEQVHFDIAELVARESNARLQHIRVVKKSLLESLAEAKQRVDREQARMTQTLIELSTQYDRETKNGTDALEQRRWIEQIRRALAETSALASAK